MPRTYTLTLALVSCSRLANAQGLLDERTRAVRPRSDAAAHKSRRQNPDDTGGCDQANASMSPLVRTVDHLVRVRRKTESGPTAIARLHVRVAAA